MRKPSLTVDMPVLPPGFVIQATDRDYVIQPNGSWKRQDRDTELPANRSMIYLAHPPRPDRADLWREDTNSVAFKTTH